MKKLILSLVAAFAMLPALHAQTTVVVERPGILSDLASAVGTLVSLPVALAEGIVVGTAEAAGAILHGSTDVYVVQQPQVVAPAPVVVAQPQVYAPAPVVVQQPQIVVTPQRVVTPAPVVVTRPATTTITTTTRSAGGIVTTTVTRPVSSYELGVPLAPVPVEYRVGRSPYVNPYVYRYR